MHTRTHTHVYNHTRQIKAAGSNTNGRLFLPLNCECEGVTWVNVHVFLLFCFVKCVQRVSFKKKWRTIFSSGGQNGKEKNYEWISLRSRSHFAPWLFCFCFVYASRLGFWNETQPTYLTCAFKQSASAVSLSFQNNSGVYAVRHWCDFYLFIFLPVG